MALARRFIHMTTIKFHQMTRGRGARERRRETRATRYEVRDIEILLSSIRFFSD